jgi:hypothetical protein
MARPMTTSIGAASISGIDPALRPAPGASAMVSATASPNLRRTGIE